MSAKRKDKKGRVLRTGESQRKGLTYQYRYQDVTGKRRTVYAPTLEELRAKEDEINKAQDSGVDYNAGNVTVIELLERYISLKQGVCKPDCTYYVEKTKTESGCRFIPMTDNVYKALKSIIANRKKPSKEWSIDGYSGFLLLDKNGNPKVAMHLEHHFQWALNSTGNCILISPFRRSHPMYFGTPSVPTWPMPVWI